MKIGICVVYLVREDSRRLLEIHLEQIARNTTVPYLIYGAANRLLPQFHEMLQARDDVRICPCSDTAARHGEEHSHYLTELVDFALADACTHVAIMHVDSFPVRDDWAQVLAGRIEDGAALAGLFLQENDERMAPNTAFIFVPREFHEGYGPVWEVRAAPVDDPAWGEYRRLQDPIKESGDPYGFLLYKHALDWHKMLRSNGLNDHPIIGGIYDDLVFHLGAAARHDKKFWGDFLRLERSGLRSRMDGAVYSRIPGHIGKLVPKFLRRAWNPGRAKVEDANRAAFEEIKGRLCADPEGYVERLRGGSAG